VFDFPRIPIIKALLISVARLKRASNPGQVFHQFAKFIVGYSHGGIYDLHWEIILPFELLRDPAMSAVCPPYLLISASGLGLCRSSDFVSVTLNAFQLCRRFGGLLGELVFASFPAWDFDGERRLDHRQQHTEHDKDD